MAYVLDLHEESDIKEQIIFDIFQRLDSNPSDIEDIETYAEESHERIIDCRVAYELDKEAQRFADEKKAYQNESNEKIKAALSAERKDGIAQGRDDILSAQAKSIAKRNKNIRMGLSISAIIFFIFVFLVLFLSPEDPSTNSFVGSIQHIARILVPIAGLESLVAIPFKQIGKCIPLLSMNADVIKHKLEEKYKNTDAAKS